VAWHRPGTLTTSNDLNDLFYEDLGWCCASDVMMKIQAGASWFWSRRAVIILHAHNLFLFCHFSPHLPHCTVSLEHRRRGCYTFTKSLFKYSQYPKLELETNVLIKTVCRSCRYFDLQFPSVTIIWCLKIFWLSAIPLIVTAGGSRCWLRRHAEQSLAEQPRSLHIFSSSRSFFLFYQSTDWRVPEI